MRKFLKGIASLFTGLLLVVTLVGCSVSQSAADKINKAAEEDKHYTVEKLEKSYGEPTIDLTATILNSTNGVMIWVNGCKNAEEVSEKFDAGKTLKSMTVLIADGKAISATFDDEFTKEEYESK